MASSILTPGFADTGSHGMSTGFRKFVLLSLPLFLLALALWWGIGLGEDPQGRFAEACESSGDDHIAAYFTDEIVRVANASKEPVAFAQALLKRSRTRHRLGEEPGAKKDLEEARRVIESIPDETLRQRTEADLLIAESDIRPIESIDVLTTALDFYRSKNNHFFLCRLYLARARAAIAMKDEESAEDDLRRGIEEYELQRSRVSGEDLRLSFSDSSESLFDEMIQLQAISFRRADIALDFVERGRARALLDRVGPITRKQREGVLAGSVEPLTSEEVRRSLPGGLAIIEYALLKERTFIWVVRQDGLYIKEVARGSFSINSLARRFRASIIDRDPGVQYETAASLYDLLIRPVLPYLESQDRIVIVPDEWLHQIPFVALFDKKNSHYLIQDYLVSVAPSATLGLESMKRAHHLPYNRRPTILVVGNPFFRRSKALPLVDLPQAERDAQEIKTLFPGSGELIRESATKGRFLQAIEDYDMIHFGGHAIANQEFPLLSFLVFAPESERDPGLLYAYEFYRVRFGRARLAVLAACDTASGPVHGEGIASLARAFMAAGVPNVVASLWSVDDRVASSLVQNFYRNLGQGDDPAVALRDAQLTFIESPSVNLRDLAGWSAFEIIGISYPKGGQR